MHVVLTLSGWLESLPVAVLTFLLGDCVEVLECSGLLEGEVGLSSCFLLECTPVDLPGEDGTLLSRCFENMACIPSLRFAMGSLKVGDSVPTFPTSFGTW